VRAYGAVGDNTTDDGSSITSALSAVASAGGGTLFFPPGTYVYATSPNFGQHQTNIIGTPTTVFRHTGTGNAFSIDGGLVSGQYGLLFQNINIQGNANSTNGMYVSGIHHSTFDRITIRGASTTGSGILLEWCVLNTWINPKVSGNDSSIPMSPVPKYGMYLTRPTGGGYTSLWTTTQTLINPIMENLTQVDGAGLYLDYAQGTTTVGGAFESNTNGIIKDGHSTNAIDLFLGPWFENNTGKDVWLIDSAGARFIEPTITDLLITGASVRNTFDGGNIKNVDISSTSYFNTFSHTFLWGTITDNNVVERNEYINISTSTGATTSRARGGFATRIDTPTYGSSTAINANLGNIFIINVTDNNAFTISNPTNPSSGQIISIVVRHQTGSSLGVLTWDTAFKVGASWDQPSTGGKSRIIDFFYNGTNWVEKSRTAADIDY
jgi:hypothetical protein